MMFKLVYSVWAFPLSLSDTFWMFLLFLHVIPWKKEGKRIHFQAPTTGWNCEKKNLATCNLEASAERQQQQKFLMSSLRYPRSCKKTRLQATVSSLQATGYRLQHRRKPEDTPEPGLSLLLYIVYLWMSFNLLYHCIFEPSRIALRGKWTHRGISSSNLQSTSQPSLPASLSVFRLQ